MLAQLSIPRVYGLFDERVWVRAAGIVDCVDALFPEEQVTIARAVPRRQREFATGRLLARELLGELGFAASPLVAGADRVPCWPAGAVGSIAHADGFCVVAVARSGDFSCLGVDLETDAPLEAELRDIVCGSAEPPATVDDFGRWAKAVFCVKEAVYKSWFSCQQAALEFSDVDARVDLARGRFEATAAKDGVSRTVQGRVIRRDGWILAGTATEAAAR